MRTGAGPLTKKRLAGALSLLFLALLLTLLAGASVGSSGLGLGDLLRRSWCLMWIVRRKTCAAQGLGDGRSCWSQVDRLSRWRLRSGLASAPWSG